MSTSATTSKERPYLNARGLDLGGRVGRFADAHNAHHILLLELSNIQVQVVRLWGVHDDESQLLPLDQRRVGRHGGSFDPA